MHLAEAQTARLICRRPVLADQAHYQRLFMAPEVQLWLRPPPMAPESEAEVDALLERDRVHWTTHGFGPWALLDRSTGSYVGRGGLVWITLAEERAVELPWALMPERWGEGLATEAAIAALEAARRLDLPEVVSLTLTTNDASRRVMEKAGLGLRGEVEHEGLPHLLFRLALAQAPGR